MKKSTNAILASVFALALALAPSFSFAQQVPPIFNGPPQLTDLEQLTRPQVNGSVINPTFSLGQEFQLAFGLIQFPQGGQVGTFNLTNGTYIQTPALFTSPLPVLGYATGLGAGQAITQLTNKSTAVTFTVGTWTGQITMNNASLANGATVKFTVNDPFIWGTDLVIAAPQQGSITASAAYQVTCNSANGSFVVNVTNNGTTNSDAIVLNFVVIRASGN